MSGYTPIYKMKLMPALKIPFNRRFYVLEPTRELADIDADLKQCTDRVLTMIKGLTE
jgi:hypothetical protein